MYTVFLAEKSCCFIKTVFRWVESLRVQTCFETCIPLSNPILCPSQIWKKSKDWENLSSISHWINMFSWSNGIWFVYRMSELCERKSCIQYTFYINLWPSLVVCGVFLNWYYRIQIHLLFLEPKWPLFLLDKDCVLEGSSTKTRGQTGSRSLLVSRCPWVQCFLHLKSFLV